MDWHLGWRGYYKSTQLTCARRQSGLPPFIIRRPPAAEKYQQALVLLTLTLLPELPAVWGPYLSGLLTGPALAAMSRSYDFALLLDEYVVFN